MRGSGSLWLIVSGQTTWASPVKTQLAVMTGVPHEYMMRMRAMRQRMNMNIVYQGMLHVPSCRRRLLRSHLAHIARACYGWSYRVPTIRQRHLFMQRFFRRLSVHLPTPSILITKIANHRSGASWPGQQCHRLLLHMSVLSRTTLYRLFLSADSFIAYLLLTRNHSPLK